VRSDVDQAAGRLRGAASTPEFPLGHHAKSFRCLGVKSPILAINSLKIDTELSEQKGIANMLVGIFGAIRNPVDHAPKTTWAMPEQDAIDVFGILSYVHRKLDGATKI
jgi:uncharacterized protein (TIGR02391 family)